MTGRSGSPSRGVSARWKLSAAGDQLAPILRRARAFDATLLNHPRDVEAVMQAALDVPVAFEKAKALTQGRVAELLSKKYRIDVDAWARDGEELWGFTFATDKRVIVFTEATLEPEWERFTLAHELGHIVAEFLPAIAASKNGDLFGAATFAPIYRRDPPRHLTAAAAPAVKGDLRQQQRALEDAAAARRREAIANSIAAEFLAPADDVRRLAREHGAAVAAKCRTEFGLSKRAAEVRVEEVVGPSSGMLPL